MSIKRLTIILISILFLQSCGLKFWYNRIDWIVNWKVDDYVELTNIQEKVLKQFIKIEHQWHRSTQLPLYIETIERLKLDIETESIVQNYDSYDEEFTGLFENVTQKLVPGIVDQVSELSDEQIKELMQELHKNSNKEQRKFHKTKPTKRLKKLKNSIEDSYKKWVGRLTKEQKSIVGEWVSEIMPTAELSFEQSNDWLVGMELLLQERHTQEAKDSIIQLILEPENSQGLARSEELKNAYDFNQVLGKKYALRLYETITKKQKKKFMKNLNKYQDDFRDLVND